MTGALATLISFGAVAVVALFALMLLAPFEALGWWAGWYGDEAPSLKADPVLANRDSGGEPKSHYIVFLDGIAKATRENYDDVQALLDTLSKALPKAAVLGDVIPYVVSGTPLTRSRPLSRFWRFARERKIADANSPIGFFINLRNLFQVLVSADKRYGPIYHFGEAQMIMADLLEHGYRPGCGVPITLIGFSGGAQVAAGVAPYLKNLMRAPVDLISLGGVISADPGLLEVRYLYHLAGSKDVVEKFSTAIFPGRWSWAVGSSWNRAKRRGKFAYLPLGPLTHNGPGNYLDEECRLENGFTHAEHTAATIVNILKNPEEVRSRYAHRRAGRARHLQVLRRLHILLGGH